MTFDAEAPRLHDRLLPWRTVKDLTGLSRTTAWRLQKAGDFPLPVAISPGRVGWRESEVAAWSASRMPGRRPAPAPKSARSFAPAPPSPPVEAPRPESKPGIVEPTAAPVRRSSKRRRAAIDQLGFNF
jgi:predicted DNA-binding transcriptional regulator AlpA